MKEKCINVFNNMIRGTPVSFDKEILPLASEYLTKINYEKSGEMINLIVQNPQMVQSIMPDMINYYCKEYDIISVQKQINGIYKTILYYG